MFDASEVPPRARTSVVPDNSKKEFSPLLIVGPETAVPPLPTTTVQDCPPETVMLFLYANDPPVPRMLLYSLLPPIDPPPTHNTLTLVTPAGTVNVYVPAVV
jgi:hypothetical protein